MESTTYVQEVSNLCGIDAVFQRDAGHRCAGLLNQFQNLAFEGSAVTALCGGDRG